MTTTTPAPSPWSLGDFHVIGAAHTIVSELLCEDAGLGAGHRVLDVACGSGNTALAAARRGNRVTGLDLVEKLVERARLRAGAEGFSIDFHTGNCEQLPFEDETFEYVFSTFGVMFAPDQERAANELLRVCKPGGKIALANWTLESMPGAMFALAAKYGPPRPPGSRAPIEWGTVPGLQRLFGGRVSEIRIYDRCVYSRFINVDEMLATFRQYFGPVKMLFDAMPPEQHDAATEEFRQTVLRYNRATDGTLAAAMTYINVILTKA
jgi:SAM-dependent methyltransferase